ncbi:MAG: hypothetical protein M0Z31_08590 [Clostridia bacterium]|nr:hypothetical protein [Clostridia bacterium]
MDNPKTFQAMLDLLGAKEGGEVTSDDVNELGKFVLKTELEFNKAAGFTKEDDRLPEFFEEEAPPHNTVWDFAGEELDQVLDFA